MVLFCDVGHNLIDMIDQKRIADKLDSNLAAYESRERFRRSSEEKGLVEKEKIRRSLEVFDVFLLLFSS